MPVVTHLPDVTVYLVPPDSGQDALERLATDIQDAVAAILHLDAPQEDVTVLFPADVLKWGVGTELHVTMDGICWAAISFESRKALLTTVEDLVYNFAFSKVPVCKEVKIKLKDSATGKTDFARRRIER